MADILFLNERCGYFGGVEQNVADAASGLRARGHRCFLAYGRTIERDMERHHRCFDETALCRELQPHDETAQGAPFEDILKKHAPDALYLHKIPDTRFLQSVLSRIKTVRMIHDHDLCCPRRHKYFFRSGRVCQRRMDWRCYLDLGFLEKDDSSALGAQWTGIRPKYREMRRNRDLDILLVGSRFMRDELVQNGFDPEKIHILPPVVRFEEAALTPVPEQPHVVYVGQLIRGKGVDLLLEALARVSVPFSATIIGSGNALEALKTQTAGLGLTGRAHFTGWVPNHELGRWYSSARVVAVPSRWPEPFGMIGLEAMRHGRPVVGFAVGGIPDWLDHERTGLLAEEQDIEGFASALEILLTDRDRAERYGRAGRMRAEKEFSFETYLDRLERLLLEEMDA